MERTETAAAAAASLLTQHITYPLRVKSAKDKKTYKHHHLMTNPEILMADYFHKGDKSTITNLLLYTKNCSIWLTVICKYYKKGNEATLNSVQTHFNSLKALVESEKQAKTEDSHAETKSSGAELEEEEELILDCDTQLEETVPTGVPWRLHQQHMSENVHPVNLYPHHEQQQPRFRPSHPHYPVPNHRQQHQDHVPPHQQRRKEPLLIKAPRTEQMSTPQPNPHRSERREQLNYAAALKGQKDTESTNLREMQEQDPYPITPLTMVLLVVINIHGGDRLPKKLFYQSNIEDDKGSGRWRFHVKFTVISRGIQHVIT
ncbi:hypothetical protein E1301_Tti019762 [Triplophysa tibetana]|uniref:Uncharacterized protein n=1 Tax=Triplophysa tibetana TaxID=1572043 RepID=A0A5A9PHP4_9TELE|nr:hypothetical protein E1301_Tti019762 [Triplophysa tibetana]